MITDVLGRVDWRYKCTGCAGVIKHALNGGKGLYLVSIINTVTGQQTVKKIILQ